MNNVVPINEFNWQHPTWKPSGVREVDDFMTKFFSIVWMNPINDQSFLLGNEGQIEVVPRKNEKLVDVQFITTYDRGTGAGTRIMEFLCELADETNTVLRLFPKAVGKGGLTTAQLKKWYPKFGFVVTGRQGDMTRQPKA